MAVAKWGQAGPMARGHGEPVRLACLLRNSLPSLGFAFWVHFSGLAEAFVLGGGVGSRGPKRRRSLSLFVVSAAFGALARTRPFAALLRVVYLVWAGAGVDAQGSALRSFALPVYLSCPLLVAPPSPGALLWISAGFFGEVLDPSPFASNRPARMLGSPPGLSAAFLASRPLAMGFAVGGGR